MKMKNIIHTSALAVAFVVPTINQGFGDDRIYFKNNEICINGTLKTCALDEISRGFGRICEFLKESPKCKDVKSLYWEIDGDDKINHEVLKTVLTHLKQFELEEICFIGNIGDEGAAAIAEALKTNTTLTKLCLNTNNIGDEGARALYESLKSNSTLTTLNLSYNNISDEGAVAIANMLIENEEMPLTTLNLSHNQIGDEGATAIVNALTENKEMPLTKLYLDWNRIGNTGAKAVGDALKINSSLKHLGLDENRKIGIVESTALFESLIINNGITRFTLSIHPNGRDVLPLIKAISAVLNTNETLTDLVLQIHSKPEDGHELEKFYDALKKNKTLQTLKLFYEFLDRKSAAEFWNALKANTSLTKLNLMSNLSNTCIIQDS